MTYYSGIIIAQSLLLIDDDIRHTIVQTRRTSWGWDFLLAEVVSDQIESHIAHIQSLMKPSDKWYAHYFRAEELIVVFREAVFHVNTDPRTWGEAIDYGINHGIPAQQLDFKPRTEHEALLFFAQRTSHSGLD